MLNVVKLSGRVTELVLFEIFGVLDIKVVCLEIEVMAVVSLVVLCGVSVLVVAFGCDVE